MARQTQVREDISADELRAWTAPFAKDTQVLERDAQQCWRMAELLDPHDSAGVVRRPLPGGLPGIVLENLFSRRECQRIMEETEGLGYGRTNFPHAYRGNTRVQVDDVPGDLARAVWERVRPFVPARITVDDLPPHLDVAGDFTAVGCNTRFRFSKYIAGEHFAEHCDSMCGFGSGRYSLLTVNVYLNDLTEEEAGRTRFYTDEKLVGAAGGMAGSAAVFRQELVRHDGERLQSGVKYLMRTDVIYQAKVTCAAPPTVRSKRRHVDLGCPQDFD